MFQCCEGRTLAMLVFVYQLAMRCWDAESTGCHVILAMLQNWINLDCFPFHLLQGIPIVTLMKGSAVVGSLVF